jgi:hypothetical protein
VSLGESIITNLAADGGGSSGRMARVSVLIGYDNTQSRESIEVAALIHEQVDFIRSLTLSIIRNTSYEEMVDRYAMDIIGAQILQALQNEFANPAIVQVTFSEWMIV